MIIEGRSPTLRHVSRTHRVVLDWLLDRIKLDPKIQIRYVESKNQLAGNLTQGHFTRDEWDHLLCWFNSSLFSALKAALKSAPWRRDRRKVITTKGSSPNRNQ